MSTASSLEADVPPAITIQNLWHVFGEGDNATAVLKGIDLNIYPGEIVIMTGPSGCGKTTILTLIGGLRSVQKPPPAQKQQTVLDEDKELLAKVGVTVDSINHQREAFLRVRGHEMWNRSDKELVQIRKGIGFIFQRHNLFESLTAHQNVRMSVELNEPIPADRDARATAMLEKMFWRGDEKTRVHYTPSALSGGQRQRVAIARALVNRPKLVLADEPTAALDAVSAQIVMDELRSLADEGASILVVTHDPKIVDRADRFVRMEKGVIVVNVLLKESKLVIGYLKQCFPFASLTPDEFTHVFEKMKKVRYEPGTVLIKQGQTPADVPPGQFYFYLIRRGEVEVFQEEKKSPANPTGKVATLGEGKYFGDVALMEDKPRNATVITKTEVEAYVLNQDDFKIARERSLPFLEQIERVYFQR